MSDSTDLRKLLQSWPYDPENDALLFISLAVWASACTVASKSTRCLDAISFDAIA